VEESQKLDSTGKNSCMARCPGLRTEAVGMKVNTTRQRTTRRPDPETTREHVTSFSTFIVEFIRFQRSKLFPLSSKMSTKHKASKTAGSSSQKSKETPIYHRSQSIATTDLDDHETSSTSNPRKRKRVRHATVYDAVAGRNANSGFISTTSSSQTPALPEHVLFRSAHAPDLTAEADVDLEAVYWASERLPPEPLPDSDLLKAVHEYAARFYGALGGGGGGGRGRGKEDCRSLDGTAMLAVGVLLEETCRRALGETGDFAFLEGEGRDEGRGIQFIGGKWTRAVVKVDED
jgi:hypothetical protein